MFDKQASENQIWEPLPAEFPIRYHVDSFAFLFKDEINDAFESWQKINPGFGFYEVEEAADSTVRILAVINAAGLGDDF